MKHPVAKPTLTIPQVRDRLLIVADDEDTPKTVARRIRTLVKSMYRRQPVRKATRESSKSTPTLRRQIRLYATIHPYASYRKIGEKFNVSTGRVSEALAGWRGAPRRSTRRPAKRPTRRKQP